MLAYVIAGKLGLTLSIIKESVTPIWPPTGIAFAALLFFGYRYAPAIFVAALLVNITTSVPAITSVGIATGNMMEALTGTYLLNRFGFRKSLVAVVDVLKLLVLGACLSTLVSAGIGTLSLLMGNVIAVSQIPYAFRVWWFGDITGAIWITPVLLVVGSRSRLDKFLRLEFSLTVILVALSTYLVFTQPFNYTYALFPLVLWGAMRFTTAGAAAVAVIISTISIFMTVTGHGPYVTRSENEMLILLNLFIGSCSLTAFIVAGVINDRELAQQELVATNRNLEMRVAERTGVLETARIEAEAAEKRARFMADSSAVLSSSLEFGATLNALAKSTVPFLADCCIIDVIDADGKANRVGVVHKYPDREQFMLQLKKQYIPDENSPQPAARVIQTGKPELLKEITDTVLSGHVIDQMHFDLIRKIGIRSHIAVPMISDNTAIGAISLGLVDEGRSYNESDVQLAMDFARHATLAVRNARLYQELQEANRFKDEFLASVSHELRTPLTVILGWAKTLEQLNETITPEMKRKALHTIARSAELQSQIVEDLLDISRIRSGKFGLQLSSFSLREVLNNAIDAIRLAASAKGIHIRADLDDQIDVFYGDPDRIQQVFWNLLSNAVKFTPQDGLIQVQSRLVEDHIEVTIEDNGLGISPDFLPYLFQRFHQADSTSRRKHGGLGLGLSLVKHFVELHGGTVVGKSDGNGMGSKFIIHLPNRIQTEATPVKLTQPDKRHELRSLKVLVVDDDADTSEFLSQIIEHSGCEVQSARDTNSALHLINVWKPDLLISDIAMPGDDGYALIKKIRALDDEKLSKIPAIALTAYASADDQRRAISCGYHLHAKKPIEPSILLEMIQNLAIANRTA